MKYNRFAKTRAEIIVLDECVEMTWASNNKKRYVDLGYKYTKQHDKFPCLVADLFPNSAARILVQCPICKESREVARNNITRYKHTLCNGCAQICDLAGARFGRLVAIDVDREQKSASGKAYWVCICDCGTVKSIKASSLIDKRTVSCGCYNREATGNRASQRIRENHPNWNPDLTDEERIIKRSYLEYNTWVKKIMERDDYICQHCGVRGGKLEAHHLYSYTAYPEYQLNIDNGLTLCFCCHTDFHAWMGGPQTPCTPNDFQEWSCLIL